MVFGSLVVLHVWLHSCLCFSLLKKLFLKAWSTPPQHLLDTWLSVELPSFFLLKSRHLLDSWWIDWESSCLFDSFSTARSIDQASVLDMVVCSSIHAWHLHLSTAIFLDTYLDRFLDTSRHLYLSRFTNCLYILLVHSTSHFCRSLSRYLYLFIS